ncbi:urea ABC transporter substrate-binding protein [Pseudonocardia ailaonensis]
MRSRHLVVLPAVIAAATLLLTGCGNRAGDTSTPAAKASCVDTSGSTVKVGSVYSLSGSTALNEVPINDSVKMAVDEINTSGGILGKQLQLITEDGASEPTVFAEKAQKLVSSDCVAATFGGYTSASRKAMLPVFEDDNALLYYGQQYEGLEASKNIFYTGATANQQIVPALDYLKQKGVRSLYLVGSDYVFPRTSNAIVKAYAAANGITIKGEDYVPLGGTDFSTVVNKIRTAGADAVFNVVVGDSLTSFFREYNSAGLKAATMPVMSMVVGEQEVASIGAQNLVGQPTTAAYFETVDTPANKKYVADFTAKYGQNRVTADSMAGAYAAVYAWKAMVEKAKSFDTAAIQQAAGGVTVEAPEGTITVDGTNHHITKTTRIGVIQADGQISTEWQSPGVVAPDPFLTSYPWAKGLQTG